MISYSVTADVSKTDVLVVPVFDNSKLPDVAKELDTTLDGLLTHVIDSQDFEGKKLQTASVYTKGIPAARTLLIGLGAKKDVDALAWKQVVGTAVIYAQGKKADHVSIVVPDVVRTTLGDKLFGQETVVAAETAAYAFDEYKSDEKARVTPLDALSLIATVKAGERKKIEKGMDDGAVIAEAVNWARRLGNTPPGIMTPTMLADETVKAAKDALGLDVTVLKLPEIKKHKMGCLLGVSQGSSEDPRFIIAEYWGAGKEKGKPTVLVGKGITFDSGGLSLKPGSYMNDMKFDMLGAATVLGTVRAAAMLGVKKNIVALVPTCENMPGGNSYRPDDILIAMNGRSVHIGNTDAEGRLILADGLSYAAKYNPKEVIDAATLTGACMVALGTERSGLFSPEKRLVDGLLKSSESVGEQLWHMPLGEEFTKAMKSDVADIDNAGKSRYGGASSAAAFLEFFTQDRDGKPLYPWAHIDLASAIRAGKKPWVRWGATGFGVQTLVEFVRK